ncbi:hypothetical protein GCM10010298_76710 [Streptomyces microflavus]|uniref:Uncharacterized protein n=1 Tax=Streptomyces microflavus TaxID=1919 RepID=A0A7J0D398_STRMI|nr:hypothetical protein Smic_77040 [Streptomyces microflavus]GGY00324.1 hypothetical protein GCM10010298_76710 [Streptomyces microflavus]
MCGGRPCRGVVCPRLRSKQVSLEGDKPTVKIEAQGLVPGQPHAQHIHGSTDGHDFRCPDRSADKDGDGIVTTAEGLPTYGDINISLTTTRVVTSSRSGLLQGAETYLRSIAIRRGVAPETAARVRTAIQGWDERPRDRAVRLSSPRLR